MELSDLKPNPKNPRKITDKKLKALKKALEEFGDLGGIVYNRRTGQLVAGHQRIQVLPKDAKIIYEEFRDHLKNGTVAVGHIMLDDEPFSYREVDWSEDKEMAANIAANKGAGEWDDVGLKAMLKDLDMANFDLDLTMFDADELKDLLKEPEVFEEGLTDPDSIPENVETRCKLGDLWLLGNHRLLCGDSTDVLQVERLMGGEKADMVFTDPPYGIAYSGKGQKGAATSNDFGSIKGDDSIEVAIGALNLCKALDIPVMVWWGANFYCSALDNQHTWIVWDKQIVGENYSACELAWTNQKVRIKQFVHQWHGMIKASEHGQKRVHPTQKPIALAQWCFAEYKDINKVLDLFLGSGSTLIACEKTKRECYGMELDPNYCDVILERWEKYTGQTAVLASV